MPLAQANRYLYANGSPLIYSDINGHKPLVDSDGAVAYNTTTKKYVENIRQRQAPDTFVPAVMQRRRYKELRQAVLRP